MSFQEIARKQDKANKQECKESTVSICNAVINHVHALYFWMSFICWPQSLQTLRICLQRGCGNRWFIYSAVTFVSAYPSAVSSLFTLFMDVVWHVAVACVYRCGIKPGLFQDRPIHQQTYSAQLRQGTPTPSTDRPSKDKSQVLITTSTTSCSTQVSIRTIPHEQLLSCVENQGRSCLKPCQWKLSSSLSLWVFWKVCAWCLILWLWYGWGYTPGEFS